MTRPPVDTRTCLPKLLSGTRAVLFDFDGPVCDLFGGRSTRPIAREIKDMARRKWNVLDHAVEACEDSHGVLRYLGEMRARAQDDSLDPTTLDTADDIVTRHEYEAVRGAVPAPEIHTVVDALLGLGKRLVIVTNNAEGPVREFLEHCSMSGKFEAVCGRDRRHPHRMKPDPSSVHCALSRLGGMHPADAVLVGDQVSDLQAAASAGVRFLGYSSDDERSGNLRQRGACCVIRAHTELVEACLPPPVSCRRP
jgi:phosphoglycolate phosphatase